MKQDAFGVVPDTVREMRPFLKPRGPTGGVKDCTMAAPGASGLLGKMRSVIGIDIFRTSRRGFERTTATKGSQIDVAPYLAADRHDFPPVGHETTDANLHRGDGNEHPLHILTSYLSLLIRIYGNAVAETVHGGDKLHSPAPAHNRPVADAVYREGARPAGAAEETPVGG